MTASCKIVLENRIDEFQRFESALVEFAKVQGLPESVVFPIQLSIDELFTNIVSYGYTDDEIHNVEVLIKVDDQTVHVDLVDDARAFNPLTETEEFDPDQSLDDRRIGGVGVHLVKTMMDDVSYEHSDGKNRLHLVKNIES